MNQLWIDIKMRPQVMNTTLFIAKLIEVVSVHAQSAKPSYISLLVRADFLPDPQASFNHNGLFSCSQYPYFQSFGRLKFLPYFYVPYQLCSYYKTFYVTS
jgi:hypothetical protein